MKRENTFLEVGGEVRRKTIKWILCQPDDIYEFKVPIPHLSTHKNREYNVFP